MIFKNNLRTIALLFCFFSFCIQKVNALVWYDVNTPTTFSVTPKADLVVSTAIAMWQEDIQLVTGSMPRPIIKGKAVCRFVQLNSDKKQAQILRRQGIPVDSILKLHDAFCIKVIDHQIVVAGSNGRGTAYGILELSRIAGVSPWVWWGDVRPHSRSSLVMPDSFSTVQSPAVAYRGIFINDEDWSLRRWSSSTFEPTGKPSIGPNTYKEIFKLLLRLRGNIIWPAMHEGGTAFFQVKGNKETADSCGILIGTSHCEPILRNNAVEWNKKERGAYNFITNHDEVVKYWTERLKQVHGSEEFFTIGMRGIHDGPMEGVKTPEEKLKGLQQVIDEQRQLIRKHYNKNVEKVPQVFIPYKEVLETYENGLQVPDDVTIMWCDDNYGYLTRLPDAEQQKRSGGGGIYYHLSYWGRPHDHLWLTTTQPGLVYSEMKAAYDHNCRKLWIANVHDPKVAAYDLELFMDMAWKWPYLIAESDNSANSAQWGTTHLTQWLCSQFGAEVGHAIAPAMCELYRLNGIRRPEFMGFTQVELDKKKYPRGMSVPSKTEFSRKEAYQRMNDFAKIEATVDVYAQMVPFYRRDAYFAHVLYPVHASAAMTRKMLGNDEVSQRANQEIEELTEHYNSMNGGKWRGLMSASPRDLPVFAKGARTQLPQHPSVGYQISCNASAFQSVEKSSPKNSVAPIEMLGHSMNAIAIAKGTTLTYAFTSDLEGDALLRIAMIPTQPSDRGDLRFSVQIDKQKPVVVSLKEPFRSEGWKQNVLRGQALRNIPIHITEGAHQLHVKALDEHIVFDQWMIDFCKDRQFYVIPVNN